MGALAFAYQHLLGTEQGQETTTFVFRTVDIWHDLTVLGQESQETPMAQGHQICLQGRLTRLYTHQSSSSTTEASNAFWDDIMIHHHLMHPHANKDRFRMLSIASWYANHMIVSLVALTGPGFVTSVKPCFFSPRRCFLARKKAL